MEKEKILLASYEGLIHDIGKLYQRCDETGVLSESELSVTPTEKNNLHTHLHCGYSYRFAKDILKLNEEICFDASGHHFADSRGSQIIKDADEIASHIDKNDEEYDYSDKNSNGKHITNRMQSVFGLIDFGKNKKNGFFSLSPLNKLKNASLSNASNDKKKSQTEYCALKEQFEKEITDAKISGDINRRNYDKLYALLQEYTSSVPSSTYYYSDCYVSLFDHLKLTSAIAGCLAYNDDEKQFNMLEFDISGIQKFIYKVTEGSESKKGIAKALRGRSFLVFLINNYISYAFLQMFGLTEANIIFNTGGGALLLLPDEENMEIIIAEKYREISLNLYKMFGANLSFVYSLTKCNETELENFKIEKSIMLKSGLEQEKYRKFNTLLDEEFYVEKADNKTLCTICGQNMTDNEKVCDTCKLVEKISDFITKHNAYYIGYAYQSKLANPLVHIGNDDIVLSDEVPVSADYIDSINNHKIGCIRYKSGEIPTKNNVALNFEAIVDDLTENVSGDKKLAILKMDVDNLGAIFAYGMDKKTRSISKYLSLSRMIENFFGIRLPEICKDVSAKINPDIRKLTDNETMFYINYAGGDDLVIIGPAIGIIELSKKIQDEFNEFVQNKNITLSAGIYIQGPKQPIRYGVMEAEEMLEQAKNKTGKNSVGLLNTVIAFEKYQDVIAAAQKIQSYIDNGIISRTLVYQYMQLLDDKEYKQYIESVPLILYSLKRNVANETGRNEIKTLFLEIHNDEETRIRCLEFKLALMFTREV